MRELWVVLLRTYVPALAAIFGVIHQPPPISPRSPSRLHDLKTPMVIGPLNGAMARPLGRSFPGLRQARVVLVSNERTRMASPPGLRGQVVQRVANAVHTDRWVPQPRDASSDRVCFSG